MISKIHAGNKSVRRLVLMMLCLSATAACADEVSDSINQYRQMLSENNPAELTAAQGEELWKTARGPQNVSLEKCDLGLGAGVVAGAAARLPRYFKDTKQVQDLESRLITCIESLQGIGRQDILKDKFLKGEREKISQLVAYIASASKGQTIAVDTTSAPMKKYFSLGKKMFYFRAGPMDFSCATCHGQENKRIRLQELPDLRAHEGAAQGWGTWPAYRVSSGEFWTMQHRIYDCFRQQRFPEPVYASEVTVALSVYMATLANGGKFMAPGLKR